MKNREISASGKINANGVLVMYMGELNQFFAQHKGERIVARFYVAPARSSEALKGYYFHYIVPTMRKALRETGDNKTEEETEYFLRSISPTCIDERVDMETGEYIQVYKEIREMSNPELIEHIDFIRQFAAEELSTFIDDPKTL